MIAHYRAMISDIALRLDSGNGHLALALANLPDQTLVCCAHEYTESNERFAAAAEPENAARDAYRLEFMALRAAGRPSLPSSIGREKACNPFLRVDHPESLTGLAGHLGFMPESRLQRFSALRAWKDVF